MIEESLTTIIITLITVLFSAGAWRFYENRLKLNASILVRCIRAFEGGQTEDVYAAYGKTRRDGVPPTGGSPTKLGIPMM